jgi:hypothetical protein
MNLYQIPIYICNYLSFYGMHTISFSSIFATLYNLYYMTRRMILVSFYYNYDVTIFTQS